MKLTFGRMTGPCRLKLVYIGSSISGFYSSDGKDWILTGNVNIGQEVFPMAGIIVRSGLKEETTTVKVDKLSLVNQ